MILVKELLQIVHCINVHLPIMDKNEIQVYSKRFFFGFDRSPRSRPCVRDIIYKNNEKRLSKQVCQPHALRSYSASGQQLMSGIFQKEDDI